MDYILTAIGKGNYTVMPGLILIMLVDVTGRPSLTIWEENTYGIRN